MKENLIILVNREKNDINGNAKYSLQAVSSEGMISNYVLLKAGYRQNKTGKIITKQRPQDILENIKALNLDFNDIKLAQF